MISRGHIVDAPVSGKLVRFLAVLPAALTVALTGERAESAERRSDLPKRQRDVEIGECVVDALRMLLRAPSGENHGARGLSQPVRGRD